MSDVLQRTLDPRVTRRRIFLRNPHDESPDLGEHASTAGPTARVRPLARDQEPVPSEQRVGRRDGGDLVQHPTAHPKGPCGKPPPVVFGQAQTPSPQLPSQEAVLFDQVGDRLLFAALEPAGQDQ